MLNSLPVDFTWKENEIITFLPIVLALVCFVIYWFISKSEKIKDRFYRHYAEDRASVIHITFNRMTGFVFMGMIPGLVCIIVLPYESFLDYGLGFIRSTALYTIAWTLGLSAVVMTLAYISAKKPKNLVNYPMIRARIWTRHTVLINAIGWAMYLFGYEFLFRGILLFPLVDQLGVWPAIAVNIALYSATHIPKGLDETIGAMPLGLVLCLLTLESGTIWIAFLVHLAMAWTNCFTALKFHPDMHYQARL
jgi:membrane protease YdiL (CAAX protease family)